MRTIIYGIGKRFFKLFMNQNFIDIVLREKKIDIVGLADGCDLLQGKKILLNGEIFEVKNISEFLVSDFDSIIIMSIKYYDEISSELVQKGYKKEKILLVDDLLEKYYDEMYHIEYFDNKIGIEIGGPTTSFKNIYIKSKSCDGVNFSTETIWWKKETNKYIYNNMVLGKIWIAEATDLYQIEDESYQFVLSSNNLEHIANPLKALKEFSRILKKEGIVLIVVPQKTGTFDHNREYTKFEHLLEDYAHDIKENDLYHLSEIIEKHDYDMDTECGGKKNFVERAKKNLENRCLHHHVFEKDCLKKAFKFVGLEVMDVNDLIGSNLAIIGKK